VLGAFISAKLGFGATGLGMVMVPKSNWYLYALWRFFRQRGLRVLRLAQVPQISQIAARVEALMA